MDLYECLEGALDLTREVASEKAWELLYWIGDDVPAAILGDLTRLRQLFINLIHNAVKFTARGEVLVRLACRPGRDALAAVLVEPRVSALPSPAQHTPASQLALQVPLRILLAEDNAVNLRVASLILSGLGYDIQVTVDGQQVLDRVGATTPGEAFGVVLMDVQMPVLDGPEAARRLSARASGAGRPWIIAMTAAAMQGDRELCLAAGMDSYLSKPVRAVALGEAPRRASAGLPARRGAMT